MHVVVDLSSQTAAKSPRLLQAMLTHVNTSRPRPPPLTLTLDLHGSPTHTDPPHPLAALQHGGVSRRPLLVVDGDP